MVIDLPVLIRDWRQRLSLTQVQAAERLAISQATFSRLENGKQFLDRETARALVEAGILTAEQLGHALLTTPSSRSA